MKRAATLKDLGIGPVTPDALSCCVVACCRVDDMALYSALADPTMPALIVICARIVLQARLGCPASQRAVNRAVRKKVGGKPLWALSKADAAWKPKPRDPRGGGFDPRHPGSGGEPMPCPISLGGDAVPLVDLIAARPGRAA